MNKDQFLKLDDNQQISWIHQNVTDYEDRLYGKGSLGCSYDISSIDTAAYLNSPEDYGTIDLIANHSSSLTAQRRIELQAGAELSRDELTALQTAIANDDPDGWIGHHGFPIEFDDGQVFTYFTGEPIGQGGFAFEYLGAFGSKFEVIQAIKRAPLAAVF